MREFRDTAARDRALAVLADAQHGVVSTAQLMALAAVLACGPEAALSHRDAAALWDLRPTGARTRVDVTVPSTAGRRRRSGIRLFRSTTVTREDVTERRGIRVTTPERTLADLARVVPEHVALRAAERAQLQGLLPAEAHDPLATRSDVEAAFLVLCHRFAIPAPSVNVAVGPYTVDFLWPRERLVVETDHHFTHGTKTAFDEDRERGIWLEAAGYHLLRCSDAQILQRPGMVARAVRGALERA